MTEIDGDNFKLEDIDSFVKVKKESNWEVEDKTYVIVFGYYIVDEDDHSNNVIKAIKIENTISDHHKQAFELETLLSQHPDINDNIV